jgi:hypothetical protein
MNSDKGYWTLNKAVRLILDVVVALEDNILSDHGLDEDELEELILDLTATADNVSRAQSNLG